MHSMNQFNNQCNFTTDIISIRFSIKALVIFRHFYNAIWRLVRNDVYIKGKQKIRTKNHSTYVDYDTMPNTS